jgi:hypothetical protein
MPAIEQEQVKKIMLFSVAGISSPHAVLAIQGLALTDHSLLKKTSKERMNGHYDIVC